MSMTEKQAAEKWCPMAGEQRMQRQHEHCLGSDCAVWRWHDVSNERGEVIILPPDQRVGYCGLAGKQGAQP